MKQLVDNVLRVMALNRRRHPKHWEKLWVDRVSKFLPEGTNVEEFMVVFLADDRLKMVKKEADNGNLLPAVQLRFEAYKNVLKSQR